mgnify:CR=1 FL=1
MKDSGVEYIGKVPQHWEIKKVRQILKQTSKKKIYNGGIYIGMENIESWSGKYNTVLNAQLLSSIYVKQYIETQSMDILSRYEVYIHTHYFQNFFKVIIIC